MNKPLKYALISAGALLAAFLALIALIAATFDPNDYKPLLIKLVQEKKQRTLKLDGDIKLTFFPRIGADLGKLALSEPGNAAEFAAVDSARVSLAVLPLLKKRLVVDRIQIDGLRAKLVRHPDGSTNIDDLLKKETEESEQFQFDIEGISVTRAALSFDDRMAARKLDISGLEFESGRLANNQPGKIGLEFTLRSVTPKIDAHATLASGLLFDTEAKTATLSGLTATLAGKQKDGDFDIRLSSPKFELGAERIAGQIDVAAQLTRPKGKLYLALGIPALTGKGSAVRADKIILDIDGQQDGNTIKSHVAGALGADLDARRFNLEKLTASLNLGGPAMPKALDMELGGAARLDLAKEEARLELTGKIDDSALKAKLGIQRFDAPAYDIDIAMDKLDLDRYLPPAQPEAKQPGKPLDFSFLRALKASGQLSLGTFKAAGIRSSNLKLGIKAGGGTLNIAPISADFYRGTLNGALSLHDGETPRVAVRQNLAGVSIGPLLKDAADIDMLEGQGSVTLDIGAQGTTISAMKKALQGSAALNLRDGALKGINIAAVIRGVQAQLGALRGETTQAANAADKTDFSELQANFRIDRGVAHNDDLSAKSPLLRLSGNGDVNIGAGSMDYLAKATVVASLEGQGGKERTALKGVTVPVRITGPFSGLKYSLDFDALATETVKQKIEQKKEELKSRLGEELRSGLKGLFK